MRLREQSGFTLVELLVVVAIIALMAVFAVPKIQSAANSSRQAQIAHDLRTIQDALERHYQERNYYPVKLADLTSSGFLKGGFDFHVPGTKLWYFYAVDDNHDRSSHAYILGAPKAGAGSAAHLYHSSPLPKGKRTDQRARAWKRPDYGVSESALYLYQEDDVHILDPSVDPLPSWLGAYRTVCRPSSPGPCDVYTN